MAIYEIMFIAQPDLDEQQLTDFIAKVDGIIGRFDAKVEKFQSMGKKKLAYEIENHSYGHYYLYQIESDSAKVVDELIRNFKINDEVLRYLSVKLDHKALAAQQKAEQARAAAAERAEAGDRGVDADEDVTERDQQPRVKYASKAPETPAAEGQAETVEAEAEAAPQAEETGAQ
ncbi:30S ribosomal protein S6 [Desulfurispira natronophila]|uniref:Small ribosomal subunit protein bS6 n=1 Tax=Desulfurispira natronophila TaxID=682562 RepID=A0A7W8DGB2_9BACT|nr:30S ribosomal protein S6 [Desulfurispira natronophila]MBB5021301.1 small subunit ribosomal protein S6 [Desulfurispira natronophila]